MVQALVPRAGKSVIATLPAVIGTTSILVGFSGIEIVGGWFDLWWNRSPIPRPYLYAEGTIAAPVPFDTGPAGFAGPWHPPVLPPKRAALSDVVIPSFTGPETTTVDRWFAPWREPVIKPRLREGISVGPVAPASPQEVVTVDKWFGELSRPVWTRAFAAAAQQAYTGDPRGFPELSLVSKWFASWSDPVRVALRNPIPLASVDPVKAPTSAEVVTPDKWFIEFSRPIPLRALLPSAQQSYAGDPRGFPEQTTVSRWHQEWQSPPRAKAAATDRGDTYSPPAEFITLDKWHQPWREAPPRRPQAGEGVLSLVAIITAPEAVTMDKWAYSWGEPVRRPPPVPYDLNPRTFNISLPPVAWIQKIELLGEIDQ